MCWVLGKRHLVMQLMACSACTLSWSGCARPQGELFPAMRPPRVWPGPPAQPRIKLVGALSDSSDLKAAISGSEALRKALRGPRPPMRMLGPHGVAYHDDGLLAVTDPSAAAVHLIDLNARTHMRVSGWGDERFAAPVGAAWMGDRLFVTDAGRGEVIELDAQGRHRGTFGGDELKGPVGIAYVPARQRLYVVDRTRHQVLVFRPDGTLDAVLGEHGAAPGQYNYPTHVTCSGDRLLVADSGNSRVQLIDLDGKCLRTIGQRGDGAGDFALPKGVAFDSEGHLYVVDAQFENVQVFDAMGQLLMAFGEEGRTPGQFWLPSGITIDERDRIWVADSGNHRIQVFEYLRATS